MLFQNNSCNRNALPEEIFAPLGVELTDRIIQRETALSGVSDGTTGIMSYWIRKDDPRFAVILGLGGTVYQSNMGGYTSNINCAISPPMPPFEPGVGFSFAPEGSDIEIHPLWNHIIVTWDLDTGRHQIAINGTLIANEIVALATGKSLSYSSLAPTTLCSYETTTPQMNGAMAEVYVALNQWIDISVQDNIDKFYLNNSPVDLGLDGSVPTGTQPTIYLSARETAAEFLTNKGSGGDFTIAIGDPLEASPISPGPLTTATFSYQGPTYQTWTVPVSGYVFVSMTGAGGGAAFGEPTHGGLGGITEGYIPVEVNDVITMIVGQAGREEGGVGYQGPSFTLNFSAFPNGGPGGDGSGGGTPYWFATGGGRTELSLNYGSPVMVAGAGAGGAPAGLSSYDEYSLGGGLTGTAALAGGALPGTQTEGGTNTADASLAGSFHQGGPGGNWTSSTNTGGAGGGDGHFGGSGGHDGGGSPHKWGPGAGGSGFVHPSIVKGETFARNFDPSTHAPVNANLVDAGTVGHDGRIVIFYRE